MTRRRAGIGVVCWASLWLVLAAVDANPAPVALGAVVALAAVIIGVVIDLAPRVAPVPWRPPRLADPATRERDVRVVGLRQHLAGERTGSTEVYDAFVRLVDERLLSVHGIDRRTDPAAADAVLSATLRDLIASPRRSRPRDLRRVLDDLESM